jgi:hypothetical protein
MQRILPWTVSHGRLIQKQPLAAQAIKIPASVI